MHLGNKMFGFKEAKEFCENSKDERIKYLWKWLCECRSKNALFHEAFIKEEKKVKTIKENIRRTNYN